jgi:hypothetical protein
LLNYEKTKPIIEKYFVGYNDNPMFSEAKSMSLNQFKQYTGEDAFINID